MRRAIGRRLASLRVAAIAVSRSSRAGTFRQSRPEAGNAAPAPNAIVEQPRPFGYVVGDVLTQRILLQVEGHGFEPAALPRAERVGVWLERRTPQNRIDRRRAALAGRGLSGDQCAASADDRELAGMGAQTQVRRDDA